MEDIIDKPKKPKFDPTKDYSPVQEQDDSSTPTQEKPKFDASKPFEPVKKKDQSGQEISSIDSQEPGTPSGKSTTNTQLSEDQLKVFGENTTQKTPDQIQGEKNTKAFQETSAKDYLGIAENKSKGIISSFVQTISSGLSDQLPKEYYTQRLRMSKGSFGDLYDSRSDLNAFGGDKFSENLPKGTSIDAFIEWNNKQPFATKQKSYDERAKLFLTEKLGSKGFQALKSQFAVSNIEQRIGFEKHIEQQNVEAGQELGGVVQDLRSVNGAGDFLSFAGNMIGQALYRTPTSLVGGPTGSIIAESAAVYDRQIDLIAEDKGISREEVIKQGLDKPAEGQALAVLSGTLDAASELNVIGMFKKAVGKQLTESVVKTFAKGFVRGAAPEALTEAAQGELEEYAASKGANVDYKVDPWRIATSAVGGIIGGGPIGGITTIKLSPAQQAMSTEDVVKTESEVASSDDIPSVERAADVIDAKVQGSTEAIVVQEKLTPKEDVPVSSITTTDILPTTENTEDNAVSIEQSEKILSSSQEGTGSQGSERGGVESSQQGEGVTGESGTEENVNAEDQGSQEVKPEEQPQSQEQQSILNKDTDLFGNPKEDFMRTDQEQIKNIPDKKSLVDELTKINAPKKLIESINKAAQIEELTPKESKEHGAAGLVRMFGAGIENKIYVSNLKKLFPTSRESTIVHEAVHLATIINIDDYLKKDKLTEKTLTPEQFKSIDYVNRIFKKVKHKSLVKPYGYTNLHEFFSEFISNQKFRNRVSRDLENKSILHRLADSVINFIEEISGLQFSGSKDKDVLQRLDKVNTEIEKTYQGKNKIIEDAIRRGRYRNAIYSGRMTANDAKQVIESAGFKVPKEILDQAQNENIQQQEKTSSGIGGEVQGTQEQTQQGEGSDQSGSISELHRSQKIWSQKIQSVEQGGEEEFVKKNWDEFRKNLEYSRLLKIEC